MFQKLHDMEKEWISLSPAQRELITLLGNENVSEYYTSLEHVHYLATYVIDQDLVDENSSIRVEQLLKVFQTMILEHEI